MKKTTNIDRLIRGMKSIAKNRCSLTDSDLKLLNDVVNLLKELKLEKKATEKRELIISITELLLRLFVVSDEIKNLMKDLF